MIKPTVGRVVWFHPAAASPETLAAIVTRVWSDGTVNLVVFSADGGSYGEHLVHLCQDDEYGNPGGGSWAEWMPYQKGQAAKTDALEALARAVE